MTLRWGALIVLTAMLAGCTGAPTVTPPPAPSDTPTPTATAEAQGDPQSILPLTCADVLTTEQASSVVVNAVQLKVGDGRMRNIAAGTALQAGVLSCTWGGDDMTDNSWDNSIVLDILPHAEAEFDAGVWQVDDDAVVYPEGQLSEYLCAPQAQLSRCFANVLLDGYWAHASINSVDADAAEMQTLVDLLRAAISSAGEPRPAWVAPSDALAGSYCGAPVSPTGDQLRYIQNISDYRAGLRECDIPSGWSVAILPGGAWSVDEIAAYGDRPYWSVQPLAPVQLAGADRAYLADGMDGIYALVSIGGSAVSIFSPLHDQAEFIAAVEPILVSVVAAL